MTRASQFWEFVSGRDDPEACWLWTAGQNSKKYGVLAVPGRGVVLAHRYAWELWHGEIGSSRTFVCHHCDTPLCVNPRHLFLGTNQDNIIDMSAKGRHGMTKYPERTNTRKLSPEQVREIRAKWIPYEYSKARLAREYGVTVENIKMILHGQTWKNLL